MPYLRHILDDSVHWASYNTAIPHQLGPSHGASLRKFSELHYQ